MKHYTKNQQIKNFIFIEEVEPFIRSNGYKRRVGIFICPHCKNEFKARFEHIENHNVHSCGCMKGKLISAKKTTHGMCRNPLYQVYRNMITRCYNKNNHRYKWYGLRGITVCDDWKNNVESFLNWASLNGYKKGVEIDRIDNDGNYEPSNCRFITHIENANNKRELMSTNKSGYRNIQNYGNKYRVMIKSKHVGIFNTIELAIEARETYKLKIKEHKV